MAVGEDELTNVNVADWPGVRGVLELFPHIIELPSRVLAQPTEFPGDDGFDGRLLPLEVQPYQKLRRSYVSAPGLNSVIV